MRVNIRQLQDLSGFGYAKIKKVLVDETPVSSDGRAIYYDSVRVLPLLYAARKKPFESARETPTKVRAADRSLEQTRLYKAKADLEELKVREKQRELVPVEEIKAAWGRIATSVNRKLLTVPDRCAQMLETAGDYASRRQIIEAELHAAMTELSVGDFE